MEVAAQPQPHQRKAGGVVLLLVGAHRVVPFVRGGVHVHAPDEPGRAHVVRRHPADQSRRRAVVAVDPGEHAAHRAVAHAVRRVAQIGARGRLGQENGALAHGRLRAHVADAVGLLVDAVLLFVDHQVAHGDDIRVAIEFHAAAHDLVYQELVRAVAVQVGLGLAQRALVGHPVGGVAGRAAVIHARLQCHRVALDARAFAHRAGLHDGGVQLVKLKKVRARRQRARRQGEPALGPRRQRGAQQKRQQRDQRGHFLHNISLPFPFFPIVSPFGQRFPPKSSIAAASSDARPPLLSPRDSGRDTWRASCGSSSRTGRKSGSGWYSPPGG